MGWSATSIHPRGRGFHPEWFRWAHRGARAGRHRRAGAAPDAL